MNINLKKQPLHWRNTIAITAMVFFGLMTQSCEKTEATDASVEKAGPKIGVLLVNHGSVAEKWRQMLLDVENSVEEPLLKSGEISDVRTAFMEYTEPSIATRMKEFDEEGYDEIIIVPVFLTVSSHTIADIPTIVGINANPKVLESLKKEKIDVYRAKAKVTVTPNLDFTTLLKKNVLRRVEALADNLDNTGLVLVAYGDKDYNQQWEEMMEEMGRFLKIKANIDTVAYAWCGHLVNYSAEPTIKAIEKVFELEEKVAVVPVLVAFDPYFQTDIIEKATDMVDNSNKVLYKPDAILPDNELNQWIIDITNETLKRIS